MNIRKPSASSPRVRLLNKTIRSTSLVLLVAALVTAVVVQVNRTSAESVPSPGLVSVTDEATVGADQINSSIQASEASLPWLRVEGNRIVDEAGETVILRGSNVENWQMLWDSTSDNSQALSFERLAIPKLTGLVDEGNWGANVVHIDVSTVPIINGDPEYLAAIDEIVEMGKANGAYTLMSMRYEDIFDEPTQPTQTIEDGLAAIAEIYADEPAVLYILGSEPRNVEWTELKVRLTSMVDAARAVNPNALLFVPGTDWSRYVFHSLTDPIDRPGLAMQVSTFDTWEIVQSGDDTRFLDYRLEEVAEVYPIILGGFGLWTDPAPGEYWWMSDPQDLVDFLDFVETTGISWTAWLFHDMWCPCLLESPWENFTPTLFGQEVKNRLRIANGFEPEPVPTPAPPDNVSIPFRANVGGGAFIDLAGNAWRGDRIYTDSSGWGYIDIVSPIGDAVDDGGSIAGTEDEPIYTSERWGMDAYRINMPDGTYDLRLHFAETYAEIDGPGQRVFDVTVENVLELDDLDVFEEAGARTVLVKEISGVAVNDGRLDIQFSAEEENPMLKGIEVLPVPTVPTPTPFHAATPTAIVPTQSPTTVPTNTPTTTPTPTTVPPTAEPTPVPTQAPMQVPTLEATATPTNQPTPVATNTPVPPTAEPTSVPTQAPTQVPTQEATATPTEEPTSVPTQEPTIAPTATVASGGGGTVSQPPASQAPTAIPAPPAPEIDSAIAGDGSVEITWSMPGTSIPVTSYRIFNITTATSTVLTQASANSIVVNGLTNGVEYSFELQAGNSSGYGNRSHTGALMPHGLPSAPQDVQAALIGTGGIRVTWSAPISTGGVPVATYRVALIDGTNLVEVAGSLEVVVEGLTPLTEYSFVVSAVNAAGEGPASDSSQSVSLPPVSGAPAESPRQIFEPDALSLEGRLALEDALIKAFGSNVITGPLLVSTDNGDLALEISLQGMSQDRTNGTFNLDTPDLNIQSDENGNSTVSIRLKEGLELHSTGKISTSDAMVSIDLDNAQLKYAPLIDGQPSGMVASATFDIGVKSLPPDFELETVFSTSLPGEFSGAVFSLASSGGHGVIADPQAHIAGVVQVTKTGITNAELGDTAVTMNVSAAWYESNVSNDRDISFVKIGDSGEVFTEMAICARTGNSYNCSASFTGDAGGFSRFVLAALTVMLPSPEPTPIMPSSNGTPDPVAQEPTAVSLSTVTPEPGEMTPRPSRASSPAAETMPTPIVTTSPIIPILNSPGYSRGLPAGVWMLIAVVAAGLVPAGIFIVRRKL